MISLIIPVRGEPPEAAEPFAAAAADFEVLAADGGAPPETRAAFEGLGARWLALEGKSRGARLDAAARESRGEILFFLHSDSRLPAGARAAIEKAVAGGAAAGSFRLAFENPTPALRWIAAWANLRSRWLGLPFGDQGLFCTREAYATCGGFRDLPVCDDLDFVRRLRRLAKIRILSEACTTSPRRYRGRALRQVLLNWKTMAGYFAGASPETLERWYRHAAAPSEAPRCASSRDRDAGPGYWEDLNRHLDLGLFWLSDPSVRRRVGLRMSGDPDCAYPVDWFRRRLADELPLPRALSVGSGTGALERSLVSQGIVQHVTGVDSSRNAVEYAGGQAKAAGMQARIDYVVADARAFLSTTSGWDAIFFHGSLHHLDRLDEIFRLVRHALAAGGLLFVDEYVGPSREEWTWRRLVLPNLVYRSLPRGLRRTKIIRKPVTDADPSEMLRSSAIGPLIRRDFEIVAWRDYGGNLLLPIYGSLRKPADGDEAGERRFRRAVERLLDLEDLLLTHPRVTRARSFYSVVIARKPAERDTTPTPR